VHPARVSSIFCALALLLTGATGVTAEVEPAPATAHIEVQALPECTTREELLARITARSHRIQFTEEGNAGPTLRASVAATPRHGAIGELVIVQPDGRSSSRRVTAPSCAEATDALALIIALMLDPSATTTPSPPPPVVVTPPPPSPRPSQPTTQVAPPPSPQPPPPRVASVRRFGVGAAGEVLFGPSPDLMPGIALSGQAALDRDALWSPALILAWVHASDSGLTETGGTAGFTLDAGSLDACALRVQKTPVEVRACANALVGRLAASGSQTYSPSSAARPYAAVGGAVLVSGGPWHLLELSGRFAAGASLIRDSFEFLPNIFHHTPAMTLSGSLGVGIRFP